MAYWKRGKCGYKRINLRRLNGERKYTRRLNGWRGEETRLTN